MVPRVSWLSGGSDDKAIRQCHHTIRTCSHHKSPPPPPPHAPAVGMRAQSAAKMPPGMCLERLVTPGVSMGKGMSSTAQSYLTMKKRAEPCSGPMRATDLRGCRPIGLCLANHTSTQFRTASPASISRSSSGSSACPSDFRDFCGDVGLGPPAAAPPATAALMRLRACRTAVNQSGVFVCLCVASAINARRNKHDFAIVHDTPT